LSAHFVPYDQAVGIPNVIVDGTANIGTVLTLSHWRRSGTPEELASDTSAEIVFKYLDSPHLHVTAEAVSNNHFDEDGLIGVFAFTQPDIALQHRAILIDAAQAGDFGVYKDRNAARIAFVISAYSDPKTSPLSTSIFRKRYPELSADLYREVLKVMPSLLEDIHPYRTLWGEDDRRLTESESLIESGDVTIEERPELDLAIVRYPDDPTMDCHPFAIQTRTGMSRLLTLKAGTIEFQYRYESWVRMVSKRPAMRIDLSALAGQLTHEDAKSNWIFEGADQISPRLYRAGEGTSAISFERFIELLERELRSGVPAWNPYD
jgi:hypothetical protein